MSSTDQWSNLIKNPYEIDTDADEMINLFDGRSESNSNSHEIRYDNQPPLPDDHFENFSPNMDINIEDFLTKELKDLDIPVLSKDDLPKLDLEMFSNSLDWNSINDNARSNQFMSANENSITPRKLIPSHKKQPSGTAIFGFTSHNKALSIGSKTINVEDLKQAYPPAEMRVNEAIIRQQMELQLALERQKEMNQKLEEQLRMNKLQQEQLQRALEAQQLTIKQSSVAATTPLRKNHNIIITSNGKNGNYQFPPPSEEKLITSNSKNSKGQSSSKDSTGQQNSNSPSDYGGSGLLSPLSRASINGSPHRRRQPTGNVTDNSKPNFSVNANGKLPGNFSISSTSTIGNTDQFERMSKYFEELTQTGTSSFPKLSSRSPITPQDQIYDNPKTPSLRSAMSASSTKDGPKHFARDSTVSTASTIPMLNEDDDGSSPGRLSNERSQYKSTLGLGIRNNGKNDKESSGTNSENVSGFQLKKPPHLQMMPTIPGSSETTPLKKPPPFNMPVKHSFQHTPTKELIFTNTTSLQPVPLIYHEQNKPTSSFRKLSVEEPECEFVQAQTPSPILRSQERFDSFNGPRDFGSSPVYQFGSPIHLSEGGRAGKRSNMLPREEIDKYIIELGPKSFQCKFKDCEKFFNRRYNARTHIQTHLCDRPYRCDFDGCQKAFVRNHDLLRHKKSHFEKSHSCSCGKKFKSEDLLIKHKDKKGCTSLHNAGNQIRKPISPKKITNTVRDNLERDHNAATLRMQHQLTYRST